ncbi:hypothetical protein IOLA_009 [uncultured bacterium]|nr:hypothetical protein IOLA_009 [uncultured bacterium]
MSTSRINLIFEYKDNNKFLIVFINNITDFAYRSFEFLEICKNIKSKFEASVNIVEDEICKLLQKELISTTKEKNIKVTYAVYVSINKLIHYRHRLPHGKSNNFIFEKAMFAEISFEESNKIDCNKTLELASACLSSNFKIDRSSKHSDCILISNDDSLFYKDDFINSEQYKQILLEKEEFINFAKKELGISILNIFCINNV